MKLLVRAGQFLPANPLPAAVIACVCGLPEIVGIPFIAWFSVVILGLVTLRAGGRAGLIVLAGTAIPSIALWIYGDPYLFYEQALAGALVVWVLALLLRYTGQWSIVIEVAVWIGIVAVLLVHVLFPGISDFWSTSLKAMVAQLAQTSGQSLVITPRITTLLVNMATGFVAAGVIINGLFNLIVSRAWQARTFNPGGLRQEWCNIRLSRVMAIVLVVVILLAWAGVTLCWDLLPLVAVAFFVGGLSVFHACVARTKWMWGWIVLFYVLLVFQCVWVAGLSMLVGWLDSVIDIRRRLLTVKK